MIVSHRYRYIFIKTKKTAGTSIEIALSRHRGPRDIIPPLGERDEAARQADGGGAPRNTAPGWLRTTLGRLRGEPAAINKPLTNHVPAVRVRARIGQGTWDRYFSFCVERNPWDKVLSASYFRYPQGSRQDLETFILGGEAAHFSDWHRYTDNNAVIVTHVMRYESLPSELAEFCARCGLPDLELPRAKGDFRSDRRHYREILTADERDAIATSFSREIALLGYQY